MTAQELNTLREKERQLWAANLVADKNKQRALAEWANVSRQIEAEERAQMIEAEVQRRLAASTVEVA